MSEPTKESIEEARTIVKNYAIEFWLSPRGLAVTEARALLEEPASEDDAKEGFVLVPVEPLEALIQGYVRATSPEYLQAPLWLIQVRESIKKAKESGK